MSCSCSHASLPGPGIGRTSRTPASRTGRTAAPCDGPGGRVATEPTPLSGARGAALIRGIAASQAEARCATYRLNANKSQPRSALVTGQSRAEGMSGVTSIHRSVWFDLYQTDRAPLRTQASPFPTGQHDREQRRARARYRNGVSRDDTGSGAVSRLRGKGPRHGPGCREPGAHRTACASRSCSRQGSQWGAAQRRGPPRQGCRHRQERR